MFKQNNREECKIIIGVPLTIPCCGKSTNFCLLKQQLKDVNVKVVSSDDIRSQFMTQLMQKQQKMTKKQAYNLTKDKVSVQYYRVIQNIITNCLIQPQNKKTLILLDKNYSITTLDSVIKQLQEIITTTHTTTMTNTSNKTKNVIKIVGILPKCNNQILTSSKYLYPFSYAFLAVCLKRIMSRQKHPTLQGTIGYRIGVCLGWANTFRNIYHKLSTFSFDSLITLSFTIEQELPGQAQRLIQKILEQMNIGDYSQHALVGELIQVMNGWEMREGNNGQYVLEIQQNIQSLFRKSALQ